MVRGLVTYSNKRVRSAPPVAVIISFFRAMKPMAMIRKRMSTWLMTTLLSIFSSPFAFVSKSGKDCILQIYSIMPQKKRK